MMESPIEEGEGAELGNLLVIVCQADLPFAPSSSWSLYPLATRVCEGASCSPVFPSASELTLSSASLVDIDLVCLDHADGASSWTGRMRGHDEGRVER